MSESLHVLLVEDSASDAKLVIRELRRTGRIVEHQRVQEPEAMRAALLASSWDIVICDWYLPRFNALEAMRVLKDTGQDIPFIIVSGTVGEEAAVEAVRKGASDYVLKDQLGRLAPAVERELRERKLHAALARSEEQLRQAQKMEAVGRLAGGVAHDFNNILSVILSYSELIKAELSPEDPLRSDVEEICKAGKRAADLTRQLLMFSRQQLVEPRVLDLGEVLAGVDKMLQRILGEDVELVTLRSPSLGRVRADAGSIEQVMMNLVVNARDAMPTGGTLTIETSNVFLDEDYAREHFGVRPGPHVMLAVSDTGVGMDKETHAKMFEPFFTTKPKDKGTGLGLSIVFGIVQQCGGSISVHSKPRSGTTFKVFLPCVDAEVEGARRSRPPAALRGSETVLLVEDDEAVRGVARGILQRQGHRVLEARNAEEAIALVERSKDPIHLLLTDVVMPRTSGPELAKALAKIQPRIRVLCMSGYTDDSIVRHGVLEGGMAYLQKPITSATLTRKVREVLDAEKK